MYKNTLILLSIFFSTGLLAQVLGDKELRDLRGATASSCYTSQRSASVNSVVSNNQLHWYCNCYAETLIKNDTTVQELHRAIKIGSIQGNQAMLEVFLKGRDLYTIGNDCGAKALKYAK